MLDDRIIECICCNTMYNKTSTFHGVDIIRECARGFLDKAKADKYQFSGEDEDYELALERFYRPLVRHRVKKLLDSSYLPCEYFYVGKAGVREPIEDRHFMVYNRSDFLNGKWEDLWDLGRLGISYEHESLQLVEPARKQERENREKNVGLHVSQPATRAYG